MNQLTFHFLFATGMVVFPLLMLLLDCWISRKWNPDMCCEEATAIYKRGIRRLAAATILVLFAFYTWFLVDAGAIEEKRRPFLLYLEIGAFHLLWWPIAVRVHAEATRAGMGEASCSPFPSPGNVRMASLKPRRVSDYLSPTARAVPLLIGITALALTGHRVLTTASGVALSPQCWLFTAVGVLIIVAYGFWIRREVAAPQALAGEGDALERYYEEVEANRRFRVRCVFAFQVVFSSLFFAVGYFSIIVDQGRLSGATLGLLGGLGGSLVGLLGAICGIAGSAKMRRIQSLRQQLTARN
jgi:hypothetical protein